MNNNKQKLELTWIGKNNPEYDIANIEPRILEENPDLSYGDPKAENMIIHGDNLLTLKALLPEYEGKMKCIFIDPPYNTGSAFEHYDDNVEHSTWLSLMKPRLELLWMLLSEDGSLWITIDDNEGHYLKVLCDEIFGRNNFIANIVWQKFHSVKTNAQFRLSAAHDHILVFKKSEALQNFNFLEMSEDALKVYKNTDNDPRGPWRTAPLTVGLLGGARGAAFARTGKSTGLYEIVAPNGKKHLPNKGRCWISKKGYEDLHADNKIWWGKDGNAVPMRKLFLSESGGKKICNTFWLHTEVGSNKAANEEQRILFPEDVVFSTPKPERLLERIIHLATNPGDLVLDSFAGSGTTGAVAHKMGRKWIMVELGDHANTHCLPRLKKVVDGADGLKLSEVLGWKGGGGFKFYELAPSFVAIDEFGNPVIDSYYNDTKLIRAMCKLMNYTFSPSASDYWKHGKGQGNNSIYVTTQMLSVAMVQQIASHLNVSETLLICPKKYEPGCEKVDTRITIKKIPQSILKACQFGKKEYLLPIKERAIEEIDEEEVTDDEA